MDNAASHSVVVMGSAGVGKTTMIRHFMKDHQPTVGRNEQGSIYRKVHTIERSSFNIEIVEINGMSNVLRRLAVDQGDAFILVFSPSDENSFKAIKQIRKMILDTRGDPAVPVIVVAMEMGPGSSNYRVKAVKRIIEDEWGAIFFLVNGRINRWLAQAVFNSALKKRLTCCSLRKGNVLTD